MARKRIANSESAREQPETATKPAIEMGTLPARETAAREAPEAAESPVYTLGEWKGLKQWKCRFCAWDTVESEGAMMLHYATAHGPKAPARKRVRLPLVDARGNPIEREVIDG